MTATEHTIQKTIDGGEKVKKNKDKFPIIALVLTLVGVFFIGVIIVTGIIFFNEKTIVVPNDEPTIQDAVDAANPGDIILVKESGGPYEENVVIDKEKIKLIGIGKEKPVLDGAIIGGDGITLTSTSGVLVKNFIVQNFDDLGIFLDSSDNNLIKGNTVNENGTEALVGVGIALNASNKNMIKGNTTNENGTEAFGGFGIRLETSTNNRIKSNIANENGTEAENGLGIRLVSSTNNQIKGNTANENGTEAENGGLGIALNASNDNMIKSNTANENGTEANTAGLGIALNASNNNMIKGNTTNENGTEALAGFGIRLETSTNNQIKSNATNENGTEAFLGLGIQLVSSSTNNLLKSNIANENNDDGIFLDQLSTGNDVFFNRAFGNENLDINDLDTNNFNGNKCDTSFPLGICN